MKQVIASLRSGNWKALLACFLYFDTGFTAWVMFGPLAPYVSKQLSLSPTQAGFLVAVPVLSASIVRVTLGNLFQSVDGRRLALLGISISAIPSLILLFPVVPTYSMLLMLGVLARRGRRELRHCAADGGEQLSAKSAGFGAGARGGRQYRRGGGRFRVSDPRATLTAGSRSTAAVLPLLALTAAAVMLWAEDRSAKSGSGARAFAGFAVSLLSVMALVLMVNGGLSWTREGGAIAAPGPRRCRRACRAAAQISGRARRTRYVGGHARVQHHVRRVRRHVLLRELAADNPIRIAEGQRGHDHGGTVLHGRHGAARWEDFSPIAFRASKYCWCCCWRSRCAISDLPC